MSSKKSTPSKKSTNNDSLVSNINIVTFFVITVIIAVLVIILHFSMYTWTKELEKQGCDCSDMWHRKVIHWLALIFLILIPINIMIRYFKSNNNMIKFLSVIMSLGFITYICIVIDYIRKLKQLECQCSEDWKREYGYIFSIIYISLIAVSLFSIILGVLFSTSK